MRQLASYIRGLENEIDAIDKRLGEIETRLDEIDERLEEITDAESALDELEALEDIDPDDPAHADLMRRAGVTREALVRDGKDAALSAQRDALAGERGALTGEQTALGDEEIELTRTRAETERLLNEARELEQRLEAGDPDAIRQTEALMDGTGGFNVIDGTEIVSHAVDGMDTVEAKVQTIEDIELSDGETDVSLNMLSGTLLAAQPPRPPSFAGEVSPTTVEADPLCERFNTCAAEEIDPDVGAALAPSVEGAPEVPADAGVAQNGPPGGGTP